MIRCKCFHVELKKAHQLLERLFDSPVPSWFDLLKQKLFRLSKLKLPSAGIPSDGNGISIDAGEISFGELKDDNALRAALTQSVDALTRYLEDALKASADKHRIFLLFDRIDENWLPSSLNECQLMIGGLIQAGEHFAQNFNGAIRPIIFLREDIFDSLDSINDRNKFRQDCSRTLKWTEESLNSLMLARINYFAKKEGAGELTQTADLFDRTFLAQKVTPTKYIYERTFCRPRDLVAFYDKIFSTGRENETHDLSIPRGPKIPVEVVQQAEGAYSEDLFEEIRDEAIEDLTSQYSKITGRSGRNSLMCSSVQWSPTRCHHRTR